MTSLRTGAVTDVGRVRTNNEDQMLLTERLFAVADGMGGHAAGEVAALIAVDTLRDAFVENPTAQGLIDSVRLANSNVIARAETDPETRGMGTTVCAAALVANEAGDGETLVIVNVGDSRAYLLRDGELSQITEDHSVADELMRAGQLTEEQASSDRRRHVLTRVLGMEATVQPDRFDLDPFRGDRLLLASDGLTNEVPDAEIASILRRIEDPGEAARELARVAKNNGGADNITVVVIDVTDDDGKAEGASEYLAKDPPRPRGLITSAERDSQLRDLSGDERPSAVSRPALFDEPARPRRKLKITLFGLAVLVLIAAAFGAFTFLGRDWYVSASDGNVALLRGHGNGLIKEELVERTDIPLEALDGVARDRVEDGRAFQLPGRRRGLHCSAPDNNDFDLDDKHHPVVVDVDVVRPDHYDQTVSAPAVTREANNTNGISLLIVAAIIVGSAYALSALGETASLPVNLLPFLVTIFGLMGAAYFAMRKLAPNAEATLVPIVALLNGLGYVVIARLNKDLAANQATWTAVGVGAFVATLYFVKRAADLERYRYLLAVGGIGLLLAPLMPIIGTTKNGARLWLQLGPFSFQPGELAKIALAIFFASYLVERRELLAPGGLTGPRRARRTCPRHRALGWRVGAVDRRDGRREGPRIFGPVLRPVHRDALGSGGGLPLAAARLRHVRRPDRSWRGASSPTCKSVCASGSTRGPRQVATGSNLCRPRSLSRRVASWVPA